MNTRLKWVNNASGLQHFQGIMSQACNMSKAPEVPPTSSAWLILYFKI